MNMHIEASQWIPPFLCMWENWKQMKDTEAAVRDVQMPHVDPEIISWQIRLAIAVDWDRVDMVGVAIGKDSPGPHFDHQVGGL